MGVGGGNQVPKSLVNKKSSLRGCPEHDCNRTQSLMHVQDLEVRQVYDQEETFLKMLPLFSVQPVQPYMAVLLTGPCIVQDRLNYVVMANNI